MGKFVAIPRDPNARWQVAERYAGGGPKSYIDTRSGKIYARRVYDRLKAEGKLETPEPEETMDGSPRVEPPPAPPAKRETGGKEDPTRDVEPGSTSKAGFFETLLPGVLTLSNGVAQLFAPETVAPYLAPPLALSLPVMQPLARIADRHLPIQISVEASPDWQDLMQTVGAMTALGIYYQQVAAQQRERREAAYERSGGIGGADGAGVDAGTATTGGYYAGAGGIGAVPSRAGAGRGNGAGNGGGGAAGYGARGGGSGGGGGGSGQPAASAADVAAPGLLGNLAARLGLGPQAADSAADRDQGNDAGDQRAGGRAGQNVAWQAAQIRGLLQADADGRFMRGLG